MVDPAGTDGAGVGVLEIQGTGDFESRLDRAGLVGGQGPIGMGEFEPREHDRLHGLVGLAVADHAEQLRQPRGNDVGVFGRLARPGHVVKHAGGAVDVPLPGRVQGLEDVFNIVAGKLFGVVCVGQPEGALAGELDEVLGFVDLGQRQTRLDPEVQGDDLDVTEVPPLPDVPGLECGLGLTLTPWSLVVGLGQAGELEVALLRKPRSRPTLVVDEQLPRVPFPALDVRQFSGPDLLAVHFGGLPAGDSSAAADDRSFFCEVGERRIENVRVFGLEGQRFLEIIGAWGHDHCHLAGQLALRPPGANGIAGCLE